MKQKPTVILLLIEVDKMDREEDGKQRKIKIPRDVMKLMSERKRHVN